MTKRSPGAERLYRARRVAARELGLKVTDVRVIRLATLQVAFDQIQAQLANGRNINVDALMRIDSALAEMRTAVKPIEGIEVKFIEGNFTRCPECGHEELAPEPPPTPTPTPPADTKSPASSVPASNVVPLHPGGGIS